VCCNVSPFWTLLLSVVTDMTSPPQHFVANSNEALVRVGKRVGARKHREVATWIGGGGAEIWGVESHGASVSGLMGGGLAFEVSRDDSSFVGDTLDMPLMEGGVRSQRLF
jgi:hypothetical protein